ncbi:hypothetical protein [Microvirga massiliensis]|uniref:hypothetical protein n=1 Tax=Microvirga massiliensis TaxID=1033741 RepID=UPI00062B7DBC|nr:hypothetical protein [Microvirga massiliensis]
MVDERTLAVAHRLEAIRTRLGARAFRDAVGRALHGIASAALAEAERRAWRHAKRPAGSETVVPFPLPRARRRPSISRPGGPDA